MRKPVSLLLVLLFCIAAFANGTEWFKGTFDEAKVKAEKEDKLIIIDFFSDG